MGTVTIPKTKYQELKKKAGAYEYILRFVQGEFFSAPPTRDAKKIISELKKTGRYNQKFLESIKRGLARSSYFR